MPDEDKPIPWTNMIYIADGLTDVPCMKLVRGNGGTSIAVYAPHKTTSAKKLFDDHRVDFYCEADYSENSEIDRIAKLLIDKIAPLDKLYKLHYAQVDKDK